MVEVKKLILDLGDAIHYGFKVNTYVNENIINVVNKQLAREGKSLITYGKWALFIDGQIKKERNSNWKKIKKQPVLMAYSCHVPRMLSSG